MALLTSPMLLATFAILFSVISASLVLPSEEHIGTRSAHPMHLSSEALESLSQPRIAIPGGEHLSHPASRPHIPESAETPHLDSATPPHPRPQLSKRSRHHKHSSGGGQSVQNGKVTFYYGSQLLNPACPGAQTPGDWSMTAAISFDSPFQCGDRVKIQGADGKSAVVTVVDRCAGCTRDWIDVTKGVFQKLSSLDMGVLHGVSFSKQ